MRRVTMATLLLLAACSGGGTNDPGEQDPAPEFFLTDVNPTSKTFNALLTPRQYLGQVSAYYFGSAL